MSNAKMWAGRTAGQVDSLADQLNSSLPFDCRMYKQDITGSIAHAAADIKSPVQQGYFGIFEVFCDTVIVNRITDKVPENIQYKKKIQMCQLSKSNIEAVNR